MTAWQHRKPSPPLNCPFSACRQFWDDVNVKANNENELSARRHIASAPIWQCVDTEIWLCKTTSSLYRKCALMWPVHQVQFYQLAQCIFFVSILILWFKLSGSIFISYQYDVTQSESPKRVLRHVESKIAYSFLLRLFPKKTPLPRVF